MTGLSYHALSDVRNMIWRAGGVRRVHDVRETGAESWACSKS